MLISTSTFHSGGYESYVFLDMTCSLLEVKRRFGGTCLLHLQNKPSKIPAYILEGINLNNIKIYIREIVYRVHLTQDRT
jgi:hypothetical protein